MANRSTHRQGTRACDDTQVPNLYILLDGVGDRVRADTVLVHILDYIEEDMRKALSVAQEPTNGRP